MEESQQERQASVQAEQWEWAYALTRTARELVDTSHELVRTARDTRVAPHYRLAADRHYRQTCPRWQDTATKALARTSPSLELQHQLVVFGHVHQRLHGHIDVLLRAAETDTLSENDTVSQQVLALSQELANAHRQLQRAVSTSLSAPDGSPPASQTGTQQVATQQPATQQVAAPQGAHQQAATQQAATQQAATQQAGAQRDGTQQVGRQQLTSAAAGELETSQHRT